MRTLFKKKIAQNALAAVKPDRNGIALARVRHDGDRPPVLEMCRYRPLEPGQKQTDLLEDITRQHDLDRYVCVSLVELGGYSLLMVETPDVQPEELRAAVRWRIKDLIDFHIDDAVVDVFEVPDTKAAGKNKMMYAVVARAENVKRRIDELENAGINLNVIDIPELALRNIAALLPEDAGGVALIYIGESWGLITITRQSTLYLSRRIDKGTNELPDTAMHDGDADVIEPWLDSIIIEIQRSLDYYESHFAQPQVTSLVLAPLPREVPGIAEYISENLEIPTRILDVGSLLDTEEEVDADTQSRCLLAIGAALRQESRSL